ncbi:ORF3 [Formica exsecta virus 4]|uniref:ORF3 n=1 Tax=Formica exsecta virus 4 TaxID=2306079 RepID=A0A384ZC56_9MONO|nr:ORF3 [Formica exsecta virus 4]AWI42883.1 ORF3 [Formica exsecta virus 4]
MKNELLIEYKVLVGEEYREYPILVKAATTKETKLPMLFDRVEYFFLDTADKRTLNLVLTPEQIVKTCACEKLHQVIKVDLEQATGAAKWELTGKKVLLYVKEYLQPEARLYSNPAFLKELLDHGQTPASTLLVSNRTRDEMSNLSAFRDDTSLTNTAADADECASALHNLNLRRGGRGGK